MQNNDNKIGFVYFVGAGPYDPELITLKGVNAIKKADTIVYDYLANNKLLEFANEHAKKIYVGKKAGNHTMNQEDINKLLVDEARQGNCVVRLKGGDPYVFGRGGEEAQVLYQNNIKFDVVPGISSAISVPAYAGIPLTFRNIASSFHVMTGHDVNGYRKWDWQALVKLEGTLVFLMGIGSLKSIMDNLILAGKDKTIAAAVIRWGSSPLQKTVVGTVENIYEKIVEKKITSPGIIVVGDVVHKREILSTFEKRILHGKRIVVTRSNQQKSKFCQILSNMGADVLEIPTIRIDNLEPNKWEYFKRNIKNQKNELNKKIDISDLEKITWIVMTSANGVKSFMDGLFLLGYDTRVLYNIKIACIGTQTSTVLKKYGIKADLIPKRPVAESMAQYLCQELTVDDKVLIVKGNLASDVIKYQVQQICLVDEVIVYNTLIDENSAILLKDALDEGVDAMAFTSASTVHNLVKLLSRIDYDINADDKFSKVPCFSIGPKTSSALTKYTNNMYEADDISIKGLAECIVENLRKIRG